MRSFGTPEPEDPTRDDQAPQPVPVLHVGEVHADLHLQVTEETLTELGSQIGSIIARAVREGFAAGVDAAMADIGEPGTETPAAGQ